MPVIFLICEGTCNKRSDLQRVQDLGRECAENKNLYLGSRPCATPEFKDAIRRLRYTSHVVDTERGRGECSFCGRDRVYGNPR
jgi:hypothetical protein